MQSELAPAAVLPPGKYGSELIGALAGTRRGPILVVGGGVNAPLEFDLLKDREFACIISANSHGFRIPGCKPDFIVANDHRHSETRELMYPVLKAYGVPIISREWWADYRLANWRVKGNSGMNAIAVAAILGGNPVIPIGFDCFQQGTHFWEPDAPNVNAGKPIGAFIPRLNKLRSQLEGVEVRPLRGPLVQHFRSSPARGPLTRTGEPKFVTEYRIIERILVRALQEHTLPHDRTAAIPAGAVYPVSKREFDYLERSGLATRA